MIPIAALLLALAAPAHAQDVEKGRSIYQAKCLSCHGTEGKGDGPAARALPKQPPDLTTSEFWRGMDDEKLRNAITQGTPSGVMRGFAMSDARLADLVTYLRTLQPERR